MRAISATRILAMGRKETLHIVRDPRSMVMAVVIPMILLVLFGYALTLDVDNVPMIIWDQSRTQTSRDFISRFLGSRYFTLVGYTDNYDDIVRAVDSGKALVGLVVPYDFARRVEAGESVSAQLIVDASNSNTATLAMGYADAITRGYSEAVVLREIERAGLNPPNPPLDVRPRVWFNSQMESKNYIVPGLIAVIMMVIAAQLTSMTVAKEWEQGTMEQLISTPVKGHELILGKLLPYFVLGMFDMLLAVLMGEFVFHVPLRGDLVLLFGVSAFFLAGVLAMGILISIVTRNQLLSNQLAMVLTYLPAFLLSGFMYPIANMPYALQLVSYLVPARYFVAILKGIYLKGNGLGILWAEVGLMVVFGLAMVVLANVIFKKKLV
jgi:ABC-2 type transport system permease protein